MLAAVLLAAGIAAAAAALGALLAWSTGRVRTQRALVSARALWEAQQLLSATDAASRIESVPLGWLNILLQALWVPTLEKHIAGLVAELLGKVFREVMAKNAAKLPWRALESITVEELSFGLIPPTFRSALARFDPAAAPAPTLTLSIDTRFASHSAQAVLRVCTKQIGRLSPTTLRFEVVQVQLKGQLQLGLILGQEPPGITGLNYSFAAPPLLDVAVRPLGVSVLEHFPGLVVGLRSVITKLISKRMVEPQRRFLNVARIYAEKHIARAGGPGGLLRVIVLCATNLGTPAAPSQPATVARAATASTSTSTDSEQAPASAAASDASSATRGIAGPAQPQPAQRSIAAGLASASGKSSKRAGAAKSNAPALACYVQVKFGRVVLRTPIVHAAAGETLPWNWALSLPLPADLGSAAAAAAAAGDVLKLSVLDAQAVGEPVVLGRCQLVLSSLQLSPNGPPRVLLLPLKGGSSQSLTPSLQLSVAWLKSAKQQQAQAEAQARARQQGVAQQPPLPPPRPQSQPQPLEHPPAKAVSWSDARLRQQLQHSVQELPPARTPSGTLRRSRSLDLDSSSAGDPSAAAAARLAGAPAPASAAPTPRGSLARTWGSWLWGGEAAPASLAANSASSSASATLRAPAAADSVTGAAAEQQRALVLNTSPLTLLQSVVSMQRDLQHSQQQVQQLQQQLDRAAASHQHLQQRVSSAGRAALLEGARFVLHLQDGSTRLVLLYLAEGASRVAAADAHSANGSLAAARAPALVLAALPEDRAAVRLALKAAAAAPPAPAPAAAPPTAVATWLSGSGSGGGHAAASPGGGPASAPGSRPSVLAAVARRLDVHRSALLLQVGYGALPHDALPVLKVLPLPLVAAVAGGCRYFPAAARQALGSGRGAECLSLLVHGHDRSPSVSVNLQLPRGGNGRSISEWIAALRDAADAAGAATGGPAAAGPEAGGGGLSAGAAPAAVAWGLPAHAERSSAGGSSSCSSSSEDEAP